MNLSKTFISLQEIAKNDIISWVLLGFYHYKKSRWFLHICLRNLQTKNRSFPCGGTQNFYLHRRKTHLLYFFKKGFSPREKFPYKIPGTRKNVHVILKNKKGKYRPSPRRLSIDLAEDEIHGSDDSDDVGNQRHEYDVVDHRQMCKTRCADIASGNKYFWLKRKSIFISQLEAEVGMKK